MYTSNKFLSHQDALSTTIHHVIEVFCLPTNRPSPFVVHQFQPTHSNPRWPRSRESSLRQQVGARTEQSRRRTPPIRESDVPATISVPSVLGWIREWSVSVRFTKVTHREGVLTQVDRLCTMQSVLAACGRVIFQRRIERTSRANIHHVSHWRALSASYFRRRREPAYP